MLTLLQGKWQSLCEAADAYSELSNYARKEKQWLLQRVSASQFLAQGWPCTASIAPTQCNTGFTACMQRVDTPLSSYGPMATGCSKGGRGCCEACQYFVCLRLAASSGVSISGNACREAATRKRRRSRHLWTECEAGCRCWGRSRPWQRRGGSCRASPGMLPSTAPSAPTPSTWLPSTCPGLLPAVSLCIQGWLFVAKYECR